MKKFIPFFVVAFVFIISLALFISPYNQLQDETNSTIKEITAKRNELALLDLSHKSTLDEFQEHKDVYSESQSKENLDTLNSFFDNWYPSEFRSKRDAWIKMFKGTYDKFNNFDQKMKYDNKVNGSLEDRFKKLKELYNSGMLTESEYNKKREELIKQI